jgi:hypothetical protein
MSRDEQRKFLNCFFFGHEHDPSPEEIEANQKLAKINGWDKLKYKDPGEVLRDISGVNN